MPSNNPDYQREYIKQHYLNNKAYYKYKAKVNKKKARDKAHQFTRRYKTLCGCIDCGYKENPVALQFDHVRGTKFMNVSTMISRGFGIQKIKEEIRKCDVRCSNCHAIITFSRNQNNG